MKPLIVLGIRSAALLVDPRRGRNGEPNRSRRPGRCLVIVDGATDQVIYDDDRTICFLA